MLKFHFYPRTIEHMKRTGYTAFDMLGYLPMSADELSDDDAVTQLNRNYAHGGGWNDMQGFGFNDSEAGPTLTYPGDPPTHAVAWAKLRDERIILFDSAWVAVVQPDGSFRVARMD